MADQNCTCHYLLALRDALLMVRDQPEAPQNDALLAFFDKYLYDVQDLTPKELAAIKNALRAAPGLAPDAVAALLEALSNIYVVRERIEDEEYLDRGLPLLEGMLANLRECLGKGEYRRAAALAEAVHGFPELLLRSKTKKPEVYWKQRLEPYGKKWDKAFLRAVKGFFAK